MKIAGLLLRPQISLAGLANHLPVLDHYLKTLKPYNEEILQEAEILVKYEGYITKERELAQKLERLDSVYLKEDFDYHRLTALSFEAREKLSRMKPRSLGQASRIAGVSPADISILIVHLGR
jgi:tRNA uridine 5-carboxymethylaminomethyl modification enzyme